MDHGAPPTFRTAHPSRSSAGKDPQTGATYLRHRGANETVLTNARRNALDEAIAPLLELAAPLRTSAQRDALAAYVIRKLHSAWNTRKPPGSRE